ncbi:MAG TPA: DUF4339 domain-containing protein, partial [Polyangiaceae bacterium]|nr:DUF4339 domain-containing protein [Polyangiaceae bacterium]
VRPEEAWHVAVAPDEVKVVSLEQLDDMFRLSLVDAETKVWQPGMSEWVSLGEVAGLEDEPPPPKRTHPKPPSPRSAPPPAGFYAEPLKPVSYAAPLPSLAPIASVRPLIVSHNPYSMPQQGGGFGRFIIGLALISGIGVSLYRNEVLRDAAHSIHQDGLYARLEQKLGGPSFGTLRAVEQSAASMSTDALSFSNLAGTTTNSAAKAAGESGALANAVSAPTPKPIETSASTSGGASPPVVSLESLGTEKSGAAKADAKTTTTTASAGAPIAKAAVAASFVSAPVAKAAPIAKAAPTPPEPKPAKVEKPAPAPVPDKPESEMSPRERLNAAIAKSMNGSSAGASKKSGGKLSTGLKGSGEYDPLNPKL